MGVFIAALYTPVFDLSVWFYIILAVLAGAPVTMLAFGFKGSLIQKAKQYIKVNNPSNQVLTLICCASIGIAAAILFPVLVSFTWWVYVVLIAVLLVKPFTHVFLTK